MAPTKAKRPTRSKQPWEKMRAITRVKNGESKAAVARSIDVPESTLRGWCKNAEKIESTTKVPPSLSPASGASTVSVPETPGNKRVKIEDNAQPQNLSIKDSTPGPSEINANYQTAIDLSRNSPQVPPVVAENGMMMNTKDFSKYYTAARFTQVFQALQQAQGIGLLAGNNGGSLLSASTSPPSMINAPVKLPNERIPPEESVRHWLNNATPSQISPNSASATLSTPLNGQQTTSPMAGNTPEQQTFYLEWYKAMMSRVGLGGPFNMPLSTSSNIPMLYNQLMQNNNERNACLSYPATPRQPVQAQTVSNQPNIEFDVPEMHCNDEAQKPGSPLSSGTCRGKNNRSPSISGKSNTGPKSPNISRQSPVNSARSTCTIDESPSTSYASRSTSDDSPSISDLSSISEIPQKCETSVPAKKAAKRAAKSKFGVLENLVSGLKENVGNRDETREESDINETIALGKKFLDRLEHTSHPGVTAFHLQQIKSILTSVSTAVETTCKRRRKD